MSTIGLREFHAFEAAGQRFLYLVPSAGVVRLDGPSAAVLDALDAGPRAREDVVGALADRFGSEAVDGAIGELLEVRAIGPTRAEPERALPVLPPRGFPLTTMVLNVTSKCNLACTYCYEYGEDAIVPETNKPRFMSEGTARQSVDWMFEQGSANDRVLLTFFGGETLLNFKVLQSTHTYAIEKARELGKQVDFSLTTNATLLRPHIIEWLADNRIGVTISIDGPQDAQDKSRVFKNGQGSYETVLPRIKELLQRHRSRPIGARVTLTRQNLDVLGIFRHLTEEIGFQEVGFAPVTTASQRDFAIEGTGFDRMLGQFETLADEYKHAALAGRPHGFSNVKDTLEEIHKGVSKAFPCGAGLGLMGVATDGDVALCHRFAGSDDHRIGSVFDGVDEVRKYDFLKRHHMVNKTDCSTCWARPLCAGGCYHEAHVRYGDTGHANLHFCEWVRSWTDTCLEIYGELAERRPDVLALFDEPLPLTA
ncbi:MAG: quinohemoprotein amine dehydrogenase maturation protein [Gemmatimonadota bacterium]